jgi:hypothetical protein
MRSRLDEVHAALKFAPLGRIARLVKLESQGKTAIVRLRAEGTKIEPFDPSRYVSLSPAATGIRTARMAGNNPPIKPMVTAQMIAPARS